MPKNDEKNSNSPKYRKRKIIGKILDLMYSTQKPMKVKEFRQDLGLSHKQIYRALEFLNKVNAVNKKYEIKGGEGMGKPPKKNLIVWLNEYQKKNALRYLRK